MPVDYILFAIYNLIPIKLNRLWPKTSKINGQNWPYHGTEFEQRRPRLERRAVQFIYQISRAECLNLTKMFFFLSLLSCHK